MTARRRFVRFVEFVVRSVLGGVALRRRSVPRPMRTHVALLALAVVAAAAPLATAQAPTFSEAYQLRGAVGDIPTTTPVEPAGAWNLEQRRVVQFDNATQQQYGFDMPDGAELVNATCTCNPSQFSATAGSVVFTFPTTLASGSYTLAVTTTQAAGPAFAFSLALPFDVDAADRVALLYVPTGSSYEAAAAPFRSLPSTNGQAQIVQFNGIPSPFWASVHPASALSGGEGDDEDAMWMEWLAPVLLGLVLGAMLWAVLVSKGVVQKKSRRQVAGTAAHVEAAATDPPAVLEGKKRALLAALKEIEVAKMNNEMAPEIYDTVKADIKRQAVTVMRALESSSSESEAPKP